MPRILRSGRDKERLFRQARRKAAEAGGADQIKFGLTDRTKEGDELIGHVERIQVSLVLDGAIPQLLRSEWQN